MQPSVTRTAIVMTLAAIISVQVGSSLAKDLFEITGPVVMVWLRLTTAAIILLGFVRPNLSGHSQRDWLVLGGYALALVGMNTAFYQAIERIPIGLAVTFEFLGPLSVALAKSRGVRDLLWVGLAGLGVALLGWSPGSLSLTGVGFALLAGLCWAGYILITPHVGRCWSGGQPVLVANLAGSLVLLIPVLHIAGGILATPWVWVIGLAVGLLSSVIPYLLELRALRTLDQRIFSILMSLEPAMAALAALIILSERLSPTDVIAMVCVMIASIGITWTSRSSYVG